MAKKDEAETNLNVFVKRQMVIATPSGDLTLESIVSVGGETMTSIRLHEYSRPGKKYTIDEIRSMRVVFNTHIDAVHKAQIELKTNGSKHE